MTTDKAEPSQLIFLYCLKFSPQKNLLVVGSCFQVLMGSPAIYLLWSAQASPAIYPKYAQASPVQSDQAV